MFIQSRRINFVLSLVFITVLGACGGLGGGCGGCGAAPLPGGRLPTDQTVEGGAQIRVTPQGFQKLTTILPGVLNNALGGGFCAIRAGSAGLSLFGFDLVAARYCQSTSSACGAQAGCTLTASVNPNGITTEVIGNNLRVNLSTKMDFTLPLSFVFLGAEVASCNMRLQSNNLNGSFDVAFNINPANGELRFNLAAVNSFSLNLTWSDCPVIDDIGQLLTNLIDAIPNGIKGFITQPLLNSLLQSFLPSPLGIAGMMDVGAMLEGISPGTDGFMEARIVPGGYVNLANEGLSLGVITGLNADEDPGSRTPDLDSEPHLCVPPLPAPSFGAAPHNLLSTARSGLGGSTFTLMPAGVFGGSMDPTDADLALGISETTLDLAGHHLVTSGGLCLGVGTSLISQLSVGTIGILVPSVADHGSDAGDDPLLLVTRPQKAVDFTIGDNTVASPALNIHLRNLEVDFYAFLYERYTRAFTMDLTMNVGINMTFEQTAAGSVIKPELVGISSSDVTVKVLNSQFVRETPQHLEGVLPSVFDLVTPLLGNLPDIPVPTFAGFSLSPLVIEKVVTSEDDFIALYADIGASAQMRTLGARDPFFAEAVAVLDRTMAPGQEPSTGARAQLLHVDTPDPAIIREALINNDGALPSVAFEVDRYDTKGRELEWSWNINGGLWRPYVSPSAGGVTPSGSTSGSQLVISDKAFAWQGRYEIGLKSRVKNDPRTVSETIREKVVIDSVGPRIFADKAKWNGDQFEVPVWDVVYGKDIEVAFGEVGEDEPSTDWIPARGASLARTTAALFAEGHGGEIAMYARDELGNQTVAIVAPFHGQSSGGCESCSTSRPGAGGVIVFGLVGASLLRRRRRVSWLARAKQLATSRAARTLATFAGIVLVSSLVPACSCGNNQAQSCETAADCGPDFCDEGELPFCIDNTCVCSDDIPPGRIGPYSDVAVGGGAIWVSAYASSHGDLVVAQATGGRIPNEAWEWVDGVPDGPVIVPDSEIRGGIGDAGPDVGMYTSIAVASDGTPMVSYFDRDTASLKFAAKVGGVWQIHVVEQGTSQIDPGGGGSLIGMYTSLTLRSDDGRPGIAYLAHVSDADGYRAEVRYAAAQSQFPASAAEWQTWTVDEAAIPDNPDEIYPLPGGLGLFVDSARNPMNQAPVVVYYDRTNGDLKLSRFNPATGEFSAPLVLDGSNGVDAGWSPAVQVDTAGVAHVVYVGATGDDLTYTTDAMNAPKEIVDNGHRIVGTTVDGLPKPEFHFVGDDANIVLPAGAQPMVSYQDATTHELLLAQRQTNGQWNRVSVAGNTDPWPGAYGFFAAAAITATDIVMSTWVLHTPENDNWVEVFSMPTVIQ